MRTLVGRACDLAELGQSHRRLAGAGREGLLGSEWGASRVIGRLFNVDLSEVWYADTTAAACTNLGEGVLAAAVPGLATGSLLRRRSRWPPARALAPQLCSGWTCAGWRRTRAHQRKGRGASSPLVSHTRGGGLRVLRGCIRSQITELRRNFGVKEGCFEDVLWVFQEPNH